MPNRLVEIILPAEKKAELQRILGEFDLKEQWHIDLGDELCKFSLMMPSKDTEGLLDRIGDEFSGVEGLRTMVLEVLASTPRPEEEDAPQKKEEKDDDRVSREELYSGLVENAKPSRSFITLMFLSVVVAAIGIFEDNVAIIIGAAVINPLLGPIMALSLATNLADAKLTRTSLRSLGIGIGIILLISVLIGMVLDIDPYIKTILDQRQAGLGEVILAIASGSAAALLLTIRASTSLVGVGAAVALLPPLVTFGLLLGQGELVLSLSPLLLFITDMISINLAGVSTFFLLGVRPSKWWEEDRARRSTFIAVAAWAILLSVLVAIFVFLDPISPPLTSGPG